MPRDNFLTKFIKVIKKLPWTGRVKNFSSVTLWVVENISKSRPIAHQLGPNRKTPFGIDADGFKRVDGKPIDGHKFWWKIKSISTAEIYDRNGSLEIDIIYRSPVPEIHFGEDIEYSFEKNWGEPVSEIIDIKRDKKGNIVRYRVEHYGWVSKKKAISLAAKGKIDNAVVVQPRNGDPFLRSRPDSKSENNFSNMG